MLSCGCLLRSGDLRLSDQPSRYRRERDVQFRVDSDDYFGTLATVVDLLLQKGNKMDVAARKTLENVRDDLLFLEKHYKIIKK